MKWSWRLGSIAGIALYVHWTFVILLAFVAVAHLLNGESLEMALKGVGFVLAVFGCVLLHELGHALAARQFGIPTRDITLLPIGGLARLERMPEKPLQELWVAIAGPLVNVAIAIGLLIILEVWSGHPDVPRDLVQDSLLAELFWVNVVLVLFNMLPAFPMDGGRVLRALLATQMDYVHATSIAATIGQFMAMIFGFVGLFYNPFLLFIAIFVYLGAQEEAQAAQVRSLFHGMPTRAAMITEFRTLREDDPLEVAVQELLSGTQHDFPVVRDGQVTGFLARTDLLRALMESGRHVAIGDVMAREVLSLDAYEALDTAANRMQAAGCTSAPVLHRGQLVGLLIRDNIAELLMIRSALRQRRMERSPMS